MRLYKNCIVRDVEDPVRSKRMQEDGWEPLPEPATQAVNKADKKAKEANKADKDKKAEEE